MARIKRYLNVLVGPQQSTFIKGRHISDNIILMQELVRAYHGGGGQARCALKIDTQKAYGSIDWEFLRLVMRAKNFHDSMINWVMTCVTSPSYSIFLNGCLEGYFKGAKGLRQGDLISPYLFILVMEVFSCMLDNQVQLPGFKFHPKCAELKISHVVFANDLFVLCGAEFRFLDLVKNAINQFGDALGLRPNL